jgi:hypothetical protein
MSPNVTHGGGGSKKCQKCVTYYLNGPLTFQTSVLGQNVAMYGLVGALQTIDRRYIDFVDGSILTDGSFNSVSGQFFGSLYGTGSNVFSCLMIDGSGNIERCSSANVICEKTLVKDTQLCLKQSDLPSYISLNSSTTIQLPSNLIFSF